MLFSHKVIRKRGKKRTEADPIDHSVAPSVAAGNNNIFIQSVLAAGNNNIFIQSVNLCQKERKKFDKKLPRRQIQDQKMCAGKKIMTQKVHAGKFRIHKVCAGKL